MCNAACVDFVRNHLKKGEVCGKRVLEVGALDVNGTVRPIVEAFGPAQYIGVDIEAGPGVDEVCDAQRLVERFGHEQFDLLVSTELLEHVRDWRKVIGGFKKVLRPGGVLLITTRSAGHPYHAYPWDFWRYEPEDMRVIFSDFDVDVIDTDRMEPGVFVKAHKPPSYHECGLAGHALFAIIKQRRVHHLTRLDIASFRIIHTTRRILARTRYEAWEALCRMAPVSLKQFVKTRLHGRPRE